MKQKNRAILAISILCSFNQAYGMELLTNHANTLLAKKCAAKQFWITDAVADAGKIQILQSHIKTQKIEIPKLTLLGFCSIVVAGALVAYAYKEKSLGGIALGACGGIGLLKTAWTTWSRKKQHNDDVILLHKALNDKDTITSVDRARLTTIGQKAVYENMTNMNVLHYTGACTPKSSFKIKTQGVKNSFMEDWQINDKKRLKLILGGQHNNPRTTLTVNNNEE